MEKKLWGKKGFFSVLMGFVIFLGLLPCLGYSAIPQKINYQGYLTNASGVPVTGTVQMMFKIYNVPSGGSALWTETQSISVTNGVYSAVLGDVTPIGLAFDVQYYLGVTVGTDPEMTPRQALTSAGYAFRAMIAENTGTGTITQVTAGTGLTGGGSSGSVTLNVGAGTGVTVDADNVHVAVPYRLPQSCVSGQIASWNGSAWVCAADQNSGGTITTVTAGDGLTGGGSTPSVTLNVGAGAGIAVSPDSVAVSFAGSGSANTVSRSDHGHFHNNWTGNDPSYGLIVNNSGTGDGIRAYSSSPAYNYAPVYAENSSTGSALYGHSVGGYAVYGTSDSGTAAHFTSTTGHGLVVGSGNVGIGTTSPQQKLHVAGLARFDLGGGQINMSTPGGWPGIIAYSPNGHRRDFTVYDNMLAIGVSSSSSPPPWGSTIAIYENGHLSAPVLEIRGGSDLSEQFEIRNSAKDIPLEPGMVVVIDPKNPGALTISGVPYDRRVAGVISGAGGLNPGMLMGQKGSMADGAQPVALTGRVYCWADASRGPIEPGDLLTTSETPGHAMKVMDYPRSQGAVIGKAMTALESGKGLVLVLVTLQ